MLRSGFASPRVESPSNAWSLRRAGRSRRRGSGGRRAGTPASRPRPSLGGVGLGPRASRRRRGRRRADRIVAAAVEQDHAVGAPGAVDAGGRIADRLWRPAGDVDLAQLAPRDEREKAAVRRPERPPRALGARQRARLERVERVAPRSARAGRRRRRTRASGRRARSAAGRRWSAPRRSGSRSGRAAAGSGRAAPRRSANPTAAASARQRRAAHAIALARRAGGRRRRGHADLRAALGDPLELQLHVVRALPAVARGPSPGTCARRGRARAGSSAATLEMGGGCCEMIAAIRLVRLLPVERPRPVAIS